VAKHFKERLALNRKTLIRMNPLDTASIKETVFTQIRRSTSMENINTTATHKPPSTTSTSTTNQQNLISALEHRQSNADINYQQPNHQTHHATYTVKPERLDHGCKHHQYILATY